MLRTCILLGALSAGLGACDRPATSPPAKDARPEESAPKELAALRVYVSTKDIFGASGGVYLALKSHLEKQGYRIVEQRASADLVLQPTVRVVEERGFLSSDHRVQIVMVALAGEEKLDEFTAEFVTSNKRVDRGSIRDLLVALRRSSAVSRHARELRAAAEAAPSAPVEDEDLEKASPSTEGDEGKPKEDPPVQKSDERGVTPEVIDLDEEK